MWSGIVYNGEGMTAQEGSWLTSLNHNSEETKNRKWVESIHNHIPSPIRNLERLLLQKLPFTPQRMPKGKTSVRRHHPIWELFDSIWTCWLQAHSHPNYPNSLQQPVHVPLKCPETLLILKAISWLPHLVKIRKQLHLSNIQWHRIPFPIPMEWNVSTVMEDWTKTRNPTGQTPNPVFLSLMHEASVSKGLDGPNPATSQTSLSLVTSTSYLHLSMADFS